MFDFSTATCKGMVGAVCDHPKGCHEGLACVRFKGDENKGTCQCKKQHLNEPDEWRKCVTKRPGNQYHHRPTHPQEPEEMGGGCPGCQACAIGGSLPVLPQQTSHSQFPLMPPPPPLPFLPSFNGTNISGNGGGAAEDEDDDAFFSNWIEDDQVETSNGNGNGAPSSVVASESDELEWEDSNS